jgi:hypothetical protein
MESDKGSGTIATVTPVSFVPPQPVTRPTSKATYTVVP